MATARLLVANLCSRRQSAHGPPPASSSVAFLVSMGTGTSTLGAEHVLSAVGADEATAQRTKEVDGLSEEQVKSELAKLGVVPGSVSEESQLRKALAHAGERSFWPKHYRMHPNASRIKTWIWVHGKYRQYCETLLHLADELAASPEAQRSAKAQGVLASFNKFTKKIKNHSTFEDTMLFKYFEDEQPGLVDFSELHKQHEDLRTTEKVRETLQDIASGKAASEEAVAGIKDSVHALHNDFDEHLTLEERTLALPWLSLSKEDYKKLRTYFSWYYAAMY